MNKLNIDYIREETLKKGFELLSNEYKNNSTKLQFKCPNGHEFSCSYNNFKRGRGCSECYKYKKLSQEYVKTFVESKQHELLSQYTSANKKITVRCPNGHIRDITFAHFKNGRKCPYCIGKKLYHTDVEKYINDQGYLLLDNFINVRSKITLLCDKGHRFITTFDLFKQGRRCPYCNLSKGEKRIMNFLTKHSISFIHQCKFSDCRHKSILSFDFFIPGLNLLIEYDGVQHYKPVDFAGKGKEWAESYFKILQIRDKIKNEYVNKNKIKLLRIPYWEFENIEKILEKYIN